MKRISLIIIIVMLLTLLSGCAERTVQLSETRLLMDTYGTITIHGDIDPELLDDAFALIEELEGLFSMTIEGSDVWRINNSGGEAVQVDARTIELITTGLEFAELSDGMFDITIGRLSRLWDFGAAASDIASLESRVPSVLTIKEARETINSDQMNVAENTVQIVNSDAWIDLGAIAKGFIADSVAELLIDRGVSGALIDLGGDVVAVGYRQDGTVWRIALQLPFGNPGERIGVVEVSGVAVVASGIYERQFEENGIIYHHILDPTTGMPVITDIVSATIVAENALIGEGLSTIAILVGSERALERFEQVQGFIGAVLVLDSGEVLTIGDVELIV
ncbi:MAG: FAD:protein FMN transferase [Oscillospiraceae bacterium]|nr:FAD:protein FMN transferase [Oscillospiraceae bacterium]